MKKQGILDVYQLFPAAHEIKDSIIKEKIAKVWIDLLQKSKWNRIEDACFSPSVKGQRLVDHVNVTLLSSLAICDIVEKYQRIKFDRDLLIAMGLLHDVSKLVEYEPDENGGYTKSEIGYKIQHGVMGAISAYNMDLPLDIVHLILTHTPYSKIHPLYKEGVLFSYIDLCNADMISYDNGLPLFARGEVKL